LIIGGAAYFFNQLLSFNLLMPVCPGDLPGFMGWVVELKTQALHKSESP
jgi:hypothetical protein